MANKRHGAFDEVSGVGGLRANERQSTSRRVNHEFVEVIPLLE